MSSEVTTKQNIFLRLLEESEVTRIQRKFEGIWNIIFKVIASGYSIALLYSAVSGSWPSWIMRGLFLLFILIMIFMKYPARGKSPMNRPSAVDFFLILLTVAAFGNFIVDYQGMAWRAGLPNERDVIFGLIAIAMVLEGCRRAMSVILPSLALFSLVYAYLGPYFPGAILSHQGFSVAQIVGDSYASMNGIFGFVAYVFITYVMLFIVMGTIFEKSGAGTFFIDFPIALMSRFRGGPAKAAVVASCFFGMISGSATANTVATGTFTIPLMKKTGYKPEVAGAIEPAASTGGMFMPPVMGAGAFLMAEMMHIPYANVVRIAFFPAILYFFSVLLMVHFEACKTGIGIIPPENRVDPLEVIKKGWYYVVPIILLLYVLLSGSTPSLAAFYAIISSVFIMVLRYFSKGDFRKFFSDLFDGLANGGEKSLIVGSTAGPVGIIVGIALLTGLAFKFSALVLSYTYGLKWMALLLVMFATFVLGMGITVTADYLILALLAVPAMGQMGIPLIAAHLSAFWYSQSSNVTPPVCMAAFAGAGIAGSNPYKTGLYSMRFSSYLYLMPFMFVYSPILMLDGFSYKVLLSWMTAVVSTIPFGAGAIGYLFGNLGILQRIILIISSMFLLDPGFVTDGIGLLLFASVGIPQYLKEKRLKFEFQQLHEQSVSKSYSNSIPKQE
jgi:TRAP transporter 4TM/12TM fusion protein